MPRLRSDIWLSLGSALAAGWMVIWVLPVAAREVPFNEDIRPILVGHCVACHGGVKQAAELSFVYPEQVLPPDGWIVAPGEPDDSELIHRVESEDPELRMPPPEHGRALTASEIQLLRDWIAQGARWQRHWAFEKPVAAALPEVSDPSWPRGGLDHFVLARLDREGLAASPDELPQRWLRRVTLDLTGLPPTPDDVAAFTAQVARGGEPAYEQVVEQLLASERFGERWASVWLDQVRYADSMGLGIDATRTIWKYRDWVIQALNRDLPYDEFTVKQIAGDLLPDAGPDDLIATACHRLTQTNGEGGTDDEEFRTAAVLDRVNTVWQTWQGITFGCVQCHSHPYEPIEHADYYRFVAFFNNTADCDLDDDAPTYAAPIDPQDYRRAAELDHHIEELRQTIWQSEYELMSRDSVWTPLKGISASSSKKTQVQVVSRDDHDEFQTRGTVERDTDITLAADLPAQQKRLTAFRVTAMPADPQKAYSDSEWGFVWSHITAELLLPGVDEPQPLKIARVLADEPHPLQDPQESLNPQSTAGFGAFSRIHFPRTAAFVLGEPTELPPGARLEVNLKHRVFLLGAFSLVTRRGNLATSDDLRFTELIISTAAKDRRRSLAELEARRKKMIPSVATPILRERPAHLSRPTHLFLRGLFLDKGEKVSPGVPASLPPLADDRSPDRLALARWLVSPENPLTARVAVNRFWSRLFGVGLVETEEDFGSSGEAPSHPALLDYLAVKFQTDWGWSPKRLLREMVLSRTYRQSAVVTQRGREQDPANRLLSRGPRFRLPAEMVRDQALAIAGLLDGTMYGPPVRPPIPAGVWQPFVDSDKWPAAAPGDAARYRRSIYTYTKRSIPYPMHATFDQPSREFCAPRRLRSNTPLQALETLNSEAFTEYAAALARRMQDHDGTLDEQLAYGFELTVCRSPTAVELATIRDLHERSPGERGFVAVATALLNLDELVMK
jgi:hypothetical protein